MRSIIDALGKFAVYVFGGIFVGLALVIVLWLLIDFAKWLIWMSILTAVILACIAIAIYITLLKLASARGSMAEERLHDWIDSSEWSVEELKCQREAIREQIHDRQRHLRLHPLLSLFALTSVDSLRKQEAALGRAIHRARPALPPPQEATSTKRRKSPVSDRIQRKKAIDRECAREVKALLRGRSVDQLEPEEREEYEAIKNRAAKKKHEIDEEGEGSGRAIVPEVLESRFSYREEDDSDPPEPDIRFLDDEEPPPWQPSRNQGPRNFNNESRNRNRRQRRD